MMPRFTHSAVMKGRGIGPPPALRLDDRAALWSVNRGHRSVLTDEVEITNPAITKTCDYKNERIATRLPPSPLLFLHVNREHSKLTSGLPKSDPCGSPRAFQLSASFQLKGFYEPHSFRCAAIVSSVPPSAGQSHRSAHRHRHLPGSGSRGQGGSYGGPCPFGDDA